MASTEHITIHCCVSASGSTIPPFIIYKSSFPGGNYTSGGPDSALYGKQNSGFVDSELFAKWFTKIFVPHARPTPENSVLLLVDGHSSHCSPEIIKLAQENNVVLLALAPHTTHLCQPLDVAVYKSFKVHLSKLVKLGQAIRGDLWISKSNVSRFLKQPFEASMSLQNIKAGFRKCGIFPFNPNAIDKTQLFRNKLIPSEDVDLSLPPEEENGTEDQNETSEQNVASIDEPSVSEAYSVGEILLVDLQNDSRPSVSLLLDDGEPSLENSSVRDIVINIDHPGAGLISDDPSPTVSDSSAENRTQPTIIRFFARLSRQCLASEIQESIFATSTTRDVGTQTSESSTDPASNHLVAKGLVSKELYEILTPPDAKIPAGRKRPLRIQSKAS